MLQGNTFAPYLLVICLYYVLRMSIDLIKENSFNLSKKRSRRHLAQTITDVDYADDIALLANTRYQTKSLLRSLERTAGDLGLHVNVEKTEYVCFNQRSVIYTQKGRYLKIVDKFTYLGSNVSSTKKDKNTRLPKA